MSTYHLSRLAPSVLIFLALVSACSSSRQTAPIVGEQASPRRASATVLTASEIDDLPAVNSVLQLLAYIPAISLGAGGGIHIQGNRDAPLFVIDGIPRSNPTDALSLNPRDIGRIEVLKDSAATAQYGFRGSNGVILISTK